MQTQNLTLWHHILSVKLPMVVPFTQSPTLFLWTTFQEISANSGINTGAVISRMLACHVVRLTSDQTFDLCVRHSMHLHWRCLMASKLSLCMCPKPLYYIYSLYLTDTCSDEFDKMIVAWDAQECCEVLLRPYIHSILGDNPMHALACSSTGLKSAKFCRTCGIGGSSEFKSSDEGFEQLFQVSHVLFLCVSINSLKHF
jgi:hypothetical protein